MHGGADVGPPGDVDIVVAAGLVHHIIDAVQQPVSGGAVGRKSIADLVEIGAETGLRIARRSRELQVYLDVHVLVGGAGGAVLALGTGIGKVFEEAIVHVDIPVRGRIKLCGQGTRDIGRKWTGTAAAVATEFGLDRRRCGRCLRGILTFTGGNDKGDRRKEQERKANAI